MRGRLEALRQRPLTAAAPGAFERAGFLATCTAESGAAASAV